MKSCARTVIQLWIFHNFLKSISSLRIFFLRIRFLVFRHFKGASLVAQTVKNLPAMQGDQVWSLGREDSLGDVNGYALQYSCLENSTDRGAWWATVTMVAESDMTEWLTLSLYYHSPALLYGVLRTDFTWYQFFGIITAFFGVWYTVFACEWSTCAQK